MGALPAVERHAASGRWFIPKRRGSYKPTPSLHAALIGPSPNTGALPAGPVPRYRRRGFIPIVGALPVRRAVRRPRLRFIPERGALPVVAARCGASGRFIPGRRGSAGAGPGAGRVCAVHPRARGRYHRSQLHTGVSPGSSRTRGPTSPKPVTCRRRSVHLRTRRRLIKVATDPRTMYGPSPARGRYLQASTRPVSAGFIPERGGYRIRC